MSLVYNGTYYYYVTDLQGDVVAIVDTQGEKVVEYLYDAWGRLLTTGGTKAADLGVHNPLRYRGYVYDPESGLYYLQSRYYNPTLGRFINADQYPSTGQGLLGNNMFAYCGNNPVSREDDGGEFWNIVIGAAVGAFMGAAAEMADQLIDYFVFGEALDDGDVWVGALEGAVYGGVMAATGSNTIASLASTATESLASGIYHGDSFEEIVSDTFDNTLTEAVKCATPKVINKYLSGKYLKLGKLGKLVKSITDEPYVGKYQSGENYLADSMESSIWGFGEDLLDSVYQAGKQLLFS